MEDRIYEAFDLIRAKEETIARTKQLVGQKAAEQAAAGKQRYRGGVRSALAACAALLLVIGAAGVYHVNRSPVSYISIDINPSVELSLNFFDKVVGSRPYNPEGAKILQEISVQGMKAKEAVDRIVASEAMQPYLAANTDLTFTVAADSENKARALYDTLEDCSSSGGYYATSGFADTDSMQKAHDCGLSFGKYAVYERLQAYDDTVTTEECHHLSMGELHDMLREHETGGSHGTGGHHGGHEEGGHHN